MNFNPGDIVHLQLQKADIQQEAGLKIEMKRNGKVYIRKVSGLVKRRNLPVVPGDELLKLNGRDVSDLSQREIKTIIKNEIQIYFTIRKADSHESDDDSYYEEEQEQLLALEYKKIIKPGEHYILEGLKAKKYNGERVEVLNEADKVDRWEVEVLSTKEVLSVPEDKLVPLDEAGKGGGDDKDVLLLTEEGNGNAATNAEHLRSVEGKPISPGDMMKLRGIKKKAKLNGSIVTVLKLNVKKGEWEVEFQDNNNEVMSVLGSNLRHV